MSDIQRINTDAVAVPRAELHALADTLASLVQAGGQAFSLLLERLDREDGDPDLEDDDPAENTGDNADTSWPEWHQRGRRTADAHEMRDTSIHEDDEEDEAREEDDDSGDIANEDEPGGFSHLWPRGAGCGISDAGEPEDGY